MEWLPTTLHRPRLPKQTQRDRECGEAAASQSNSPHYPVFTSKRTHERARISRLNQPSRVSSIDRGYKPAAGNAATEFLARRVGFSGL